jgi:hypothetical protein
VAKHAFFYEHDKLNLVSIYRGRAASPGASQAADDEEDGSHADETKQQELREKLLLKSRPGTVARRREVRTILQLQNLVSRELSTKIKKKKMSCILLKDITNLNNAIFSIIFFAPLLLRASVFEK